MAKFSVKKPFTVLVAVLMILMLGVVSMTRMQLDLLPDMSLPYLLVITTYPGASPEKVESTVSEPMESGLGTISGVKNVYSFSYENYSMVELEFEDGTDMDSVLVKVSSALDTVEASLPDECGTPSIMEISMDMMATMYIAVGYEGMDINELSTFTRDTLTPALERVDGVASISSIGLVDKTVQVELNQEKVDALNAKILKVAEDALSDAEQELDDAKKQLEDSEKELADGQAELRKGENELKESKDKLNQSKEDLESEASSTYSTLATASEALDQLASYQTQLTNQQAQLSVLNSAISQYESGIKTAEEGKASLTAVKTYITSELLEGDSLKSNSTVTSIDSTPAIFETYPGTAYTNIEYVIGALTQIGIDTTELTTAVGEYQAAISSNTGGAQAISDAKTHIATCLNSAVTQITVMEESIDAQLTTANETLSSYEAEKNALTLEIQVTQGIISKYTAQLKSLGVSYTDIEKAKMEASAGFGNAQAQIAQGEAAIESAESQLESSKDTLDSAKDQIESGWDSYYEGVEQFESSKEEALKSANADELLTLSTLSSLIYAQNFEMPAGYIDDENDDSWLLKVGDNFDSIEELEDLVLCTIDDVGDVKLSDVADITIIDNSDDSYASLNGEKAIILSIFKASTSGTNEVSKSLTEAIDDLEEKYEGLDVMIMMNQGDYIDLIVSSVVQNMAIGAALAIFILAIFLKDFMPTVVVAISIPLSVLTAFVAMYFTGISLNMMSLSGMALGIGMLVDNSIVVIENIYRLRNRGVSAPRAAVQGTRQVAGAVIASTLTSVCVFFPMVYTTGTVRELMLPMSLTIIYCLLASLLVAMTVVPAASSTLLRNTKPKEHPWFDKIQDFYSKILDFCLRIKVVPLGISIGLLAVSIWLVFRMGVVMIPNITTNQIQGTITFDEEQITRDEAYAKADEFIAKACNIEGVDSVGIMMGASSSLVASSDTGYETFTYMVTTEDENAGAGVVKEICNELESIADELSLDASVSTGMEELTSMLGSGLSISIYGSDADTLLSISEDVMELVDSVEGYTDISNGQEEADSVLHLYINKDYAMSKGLTVAGIYQTLAGKLTTSSTAVTVTIDGEDMDVSVVNDLDELTVENLMDTEFDVTEENEDGEKETVTKHLSDFATLETEDGFTSISRENQTRYITVTAAVEDGYSNNILSRKIEPLISSYECPDGYSIEIGGETETVNTMVRQMALIILMGIAFIYFVMVAQFQSLLSPFIVLFTIPLAFTGGFLALFFANETISMIALMGFVVLTGTVVNNGIVYVDYVNQLRKGGLSRHDALIATGVTRMRPILMTALTTILAEASLIFGDDMGSQMGRGMALVIAGGLLYATLMTLFIIPVMYDILFKKQPLDIDTGSENLDDVPDDAKEYLLSKEEKA